MKAENARCRSCNKEGLEVFLDLGAKPPSDRILTEEMLKQEEPLYPLEVAFLPSLQSGANFGNHSARRFVYRWL